MKPEEKITVGDKILSLKQNIIRNLNRAEDEGFIRYYAFIKQDIEMLNVLRKAKKIRDQEESK